MSREFTCIGSPLPGMLWQERVPRMPEFSSGSIGFRASVWFKPEAKYTG